ncbi:chromate transporter [Paenibacillus monticola]|uniref:Chromate transporter n=1 Tax=Paenibacillus monticola TaxID=2666075 RepID=A0A7X2L1C8_9BACL|nr:chromate transporter [Paenibacillus monticola]MRN52191.1 chromate transporter [Paenibacillus monticola]
MRNEFKSKLVMLWDLFWIFFKIGPSTFGGGYAMLAIIDREVVEKRKWIDEQEMSDLLSLAGSAPGGVGVNSSAFIGYRMGKIPGAIAAVLGITLPTFLIIYMLSVVYSLVQNEPKMQSAFKGINGAVIGLIAVAAYKMGKVALFDLATIILALGSLLMLLLTGWNPIFMIMMGLALGIIIIYAKQQLGMNVITEKESVNGSAVSGVIEYYI